MSRISLLSPATLRHVISQLQQSEVEELRISWAGGELRIQRNLSIESGPRPALPEGGSDVVTIAAPLTGIFYVRPSPEQEAFVVLGGTVRVGQVVALIETMKLFNEVVSDVQGVVQDIAVNDGDLVEEGQVLIRLGAAGQEGANG